MLGDSGPDSSDAGFILDAGGSESWLDKWEDLYQDKRHMADKMSGRKFSGDITDFAGDIVGYRQEDLVEGG